MSEEEEQKRDMQWRKVAIVVSIAGVVLRGIGLLLGR